MSRTEALPSGTFKGVSNRNNGNPYIVWEVNISMSEWAAWLNADARRPVLDTTGLVGEFLFHLESDEKGVSRPPLLRAIEEIGLKLEEAKRPVEVWVIERAEKPSPN